MWRKFETFLKKILDRDFSEIVDVRTRKIWKIRSEENLAENNFTKNVGKN